ncbi:hypothetical protein FOA43_001592 [Brettanomyces nanus]|uniref:Uncharacterized protein n=1 Tax=Eeniella nana TaxID=13502 RepID=A0A875RU78_EENNA|nr:uncharacterized protein FOA43_001592 [Brettanomyces nanus]QPG74267.1 hypothetical protein FOA43_001592 [Brettanomyces nanus]
MSVASPTLSPIRGNHKSVAVLSDLQDKNYIKREAHLTGLLGKSKPVTVVRGTKEFISTEIYDGEGTILNEEVSFDDASNDEDMNSPGGSHVENEKAALQQADAVEATTTTTTTDMMSLDEDVGEAEDAISVNEDAPQELEDELECDDSPKEASNETKILTEEQFVDSEGAAIEVSASRTSTISLRIPNPPADLKPQSSFDFQKFLSEFKAKECQPIHRYLKSFLVQFGQRNWNIDEQVKLVKDFEDFLLKKMLEYFPFNTMQTEDEIRNCKEGLEKLIMTRLYSQVFSPAVPPNKLSEQHQNDRISDRSYARNVRLYDWIELRHLDVPMELNLHSSFIQLAAKELNKINNYKSPRDKVICILNCCKIIFGLIRQQQKLHNIEENADSFVPLLIYVIFLAKTTFLYSNLAYIERYRNPDFLIGESSYYVSTLQIACNFIVDISKDQLTIDDDEYQKNMASSKGRLEKEKEKRKQQHTGTGTSSPLPRRLTDFISQTSVESPSEVLTKSAELMKQRLSSSLNSFFQSDTTIESDSLTDEHSSRQSHRGEFGSLAATEKQLEQIKQLSIKEHKLEVENRKKHQETFDSLQNMFPDMDKGIIQDVLADTLNSDGSNIGECVDALLALNNE